MKSVVLTTLIVIGILAGVLLAVAYTGVVNVAATRDHLPGVRWFLDTTQMSSIEHHASDVPQGVDLTDPSMVEAGFEAYRSMCVTCHGAPGVEPSEIGKGLNPMPPDLSESHLNAGETFWVLDNGIRMTGMPAFGKTHSEDELWPIVAFLGELHEMSAGDYARLESSAGGSRESGHPHGSATEEEQEGGKPGSHPE